MAFNTLTFWISFTGFLIIYKCLPRRGQNALLLLANFVMMALWNPWLPGVISALALFIFFLALRLEKAQTKRRDLLWAVTAVVVGLLLALRLLKWQSPGQLTPTTAAFTGVSFISLQLLGYFISVYRLQQAPSRDSFGFLLFATFFPIAQMGPIERFEHLYPQFELRQPSTDWTRGLNLIVLGLIKKLAIADPLSNFTFSATPSLSLLTGGALWVYSLTSFVQVYADFSGYIDIARGISVLLGFEITENFIQPYLARNIGDVWRRWNISLMSWFNEFVYLPLILKTKNLYLSAAAVMALSGIWHGLSWRFALWAISWTLAYWIYLFYRIRARRRPPALFGWRGPITVLSIAVTLIVSSLSTLVFMSDSLGDYLQVWMRALTFSVHDFESLILRAEQTSLQGLPVFASCVVVIIAESFMVNFKRAPLLNFRQAPLLLFFLLLFALAALASGESHHFIYLRY